MTVPGRSEVACEAARLMAEQGIADYALAKTKALEIWPGQGRLLPTNLEVADCLREYLQRFQAEDWLERLRNLRQAAVQAMILCSVFHPRAVGAVVNGLATVRSPVQLHVFCPFDEALDFHLADRNIPFDTSERRFRHPGGQEVRRPTCVFVAGDIDIEIAIFAEQDLRWSPLSPIDGRPMRRWSLKELEANCV